MGAGSTGVRRWFTFCAAHGVTPQRPMDPVAPLRTRLEEEWLVMRFVVALVERHFVGRYAGSPAHAGRRVAEERFTSKLVSNPEIIELLRKSLRW